MAAALTPALMIQGTGSDVGKSLLVAGLCRAARRRGVAVVPLKPQNMSNNAAVTAGGGEIGRAQALQALAAGVEPTVHMNPVLLKPQSDTGAQVVVHGRAVGVAEASDYQRRRRPTLLGAVLESFDVLSAQADLILVEGAGSPAETNLRRGDIANMGFAVAAGVPVVIAGDIDRGGVIAQLVGTHAVLDAADRAMVRGFIVNRFRGDPALFDDGYAEIERRTGWRGYGVVPWFAGAALLPAEDAVDAGRRGAARGDGPIAVRIACPMLSRIANFDDLDPLAAEPGVQLEMVPPGRPLPGDADLVILPGTKSTRGDLAFLRAQGWDIDLLAHVRRGGRVLGICGGYQLLGSAIRDPGGVDGAPGDSDGLGLLDVVTEMAEQKRTTRAAGVHAASGEALHGYEIHAGRTSGPDAARPFARLAGSDGGAEHADGARSADGQIEGTYLHGMFAGDRFRRAYLAELGLGGAGDGPGHAARIDRVLDDLADHLEASLDIDALLAAARR